MGAGPNSGGHPPEGRAGPPQQLGNVERMYLFMERHPEVTITVPRKNGTADFIATWEEDGEPKELRDRSLGWLMDKMEARDA